MSLHRNSSVWPAMGNLFKMVTLQSPLWEREIESGVPLVRNPRRAMPSVRKGSIMTPRAEDLLSRGWGRCLCRERQDKGAALWPLFIAPSEAFRTSPCLAAATPLLCPLGPDGLGDHPHTGVSQHQRRGHLPAQRELPRRQHPGWSWHESSNISSLGHGFCSAFKVLLDLFFFLGKKSSMEIHYCNVELLNYILLKDKNQKLVHRRL